MFDHTGWALFDVDPDVKKWAEAALPRAIAAMEDPDYAQWHQCGGTWFVGIDALDNDASGQIGEVPLCGAAIDFLQKRYGVLELHRGQVSTTFPGYPKPREGESDAAFRFRRDRGAAHVDGLLGLGDPKRRYLKEPHAYILGLPLNATSAGAAPLVIWEGSHLVMQAAFAEAFQGVAPQFWSDVDVTEIYQQARRRVFERCKRIVVNGPPGSAYVLHRQLVHGVGPWQEGAEAPVEGRIVAYFRPMLPGGARVWMDRDF